MAVSASFSLGGIQLFAVCPALVCSAASHNTLHYLLTNVGPLIMLLPFVLSSAYERVMIERTWDGTYGHPGSRSAILAHPGANVPFDPNDEMHEEAIKHWIKFADFYVWPHIQTFDSWEELIGECWGAICPASCNCSEIYVLAMQQLSW